VSHWGFYVDLKYCVRCVPSHDRFNIFALLLEVTPLMPRARFWGYDVIFSECGLSIGALTLIPTYCNTLDAVLGYDGILSGCEL